jgi:hypothetical protein
MESQNILYMTPALSIVDSVVVYGFEAMTYSLYIKKYLFSR